MYIESLLYTPETNIMLYEKEKIQIVLTENKEGSDDQVIWEVLSKEWYWIWIRSSQPP